ncbi:MAG: response regulator transcription factor, partial [Bacteroidales bacterium]|nr:response regulator transcription factor [Bacteroidales bacterium]
NDISRREEEIIQQICEGKSNKEISEALYISLQTVKDHIYRIFIKTGVKNRIQLTNLIRTFKSQGRSTTDTKNF